MSNLRVRRIPFEFKDVEFIWNPENPAFSIIGNLVSFGAVGFERWLCLAFRQAQDLIRDPAVREECELFIKQEAIHSAVHANHCKELIVQYPEFAQTQEKVIDYYCKLLDEKPLELNVAMGAALESTFTPTFRYIIDNRRSLMHGGDARVASALLWHFCEEIEHRSSALNVYQHIYGNRFRLLEILPQSLLYMRGLSGLMIREFVRVVPEEMARARLSEAWAGIPSWQKYRMLFNLLLSQTPWHNPKRAALPRWANKWHAAYDAGTDMTQFVGVRVGGCEPIVPELRSE
ncbi:MAG: metal-dependent hydrolase [Chrysiogenetes bacterium]|nr:metal-dependent hydrolase [Chrysiogenetes bacterium]